MVTILQRELQREARRPRALWTRVLSSGVGFTACLILLLHNGGGAHGRYVFDAITAVAFWFCLTQGVRVAAGAIADEKRDGTLGLLFLTSLTPLGIVVGKFFAVAIPLIQPFLAMVPALAITLLHGGVTVSEIVRAVAAVGTVLVFSIAPGRVGPRRRQLLRRLTMFAAIPFFELRVYNLDVPGVGNLPLDPWAILVCIGFVVGLEIARYRAIRLGLDVRDLVDGALVTVGMGFVVAHIVTVLFYFPERLETDGIMSILRVWEGFSSTGGFLGAVLGAFLYYRVWKKLPALRYADTICYGFPFGWFFGRLGCGVVHDHVGSLTTFPLAMNFDSGFGPWAEGSAYVEGIRHELGLYEAAYLVPMMIAFYVLGRKDRVPGFFLALFGALYAPVRFVLEFLRNHDLDHQDARYLGLTPAQYGMIVLFVVALVFLARLDHRGWKGVDLSGKPAADPVAGG